MAWDVEASPATPPQSHVGTLHTDSSAPGAADGAEFVLPLPPHAIAAPGETPSLPLETEADSAGRSLAELVGDYADSQADDAEHECLAGAVYFEAKGEPLEGQLAVAEVVLNRAESGLYPSSICGVVKQKRQFSFVRDGRIPLIPKQSKAWRKAVAIAHIARNELAESEGADALFFHADYVRPNWRGKTRVAALGRHIFYR